MLDRKFCYESNDILLICEQSLLVGLFPKYGCTVRVIKVVNFWHFVVFRFSHPSSFLTRNVWISGLGYGL